MRRPFVLFLALMASLVWVVPCLAAGEPVDQRIEQTRSALQQAKKREQSALGVLSKNQKDLNKIQSNLTAINSQLQTAQTRATNTRDELEQVEAELLALEEKLEQRRTLLRKRVNAFYRRGPMCYLEVMLSAASFSDLINRYELSSYFIRFDLRLLNEYRCTYAEIGAKRREIEARHEELAARTRAISMLKDQAGKQQQQAAEKVRLTQQEVAKIQADRVRLEQALEELEQLSRELGSEMRRKGSGTSLGTGKMMWPVLGRLSSDFGWRRHPVLKRNKFHSGQDIAIPSRTPVLSADSGIVRIAGWQGGYGYLVAIDHGRGLSTFYAHNSALLVKEGDVVVKGQRIALSGSTGLSTGPHLHFEVRINGEPVNPIPYLP